MKKYNKYLLYFISSAYIILTIIEFIKYLLTKSNLFGLVYLIITALIIFFLVPTTINYKEKVSFARTSKFIIIIIIGIFCSFFLDSIVINNLKYIDYSQKYCDSIFIIKNVLKVILYVFILIVIMLDHNVFSIVCEKIKKVLKK